MDGEVQVLLPLYEGEPYVEDLVRSVLAQDHRPLSLLVRDDGSSDGSADHLLDLVRGSDVAVRLLPPGPRLGPFRSFLALLDAADDVPFVAFADQDDVWDRDKLSRAVRALSRQPDPSCYGSAVQVTDSELRPLTRTVAPRGGPSFRHALFENAAPAATLVLTAGFRRLLLGRLPRAEVYPDLWCYQVSTALGCPFVFESEPSLQYRQHSSNAVGLATTPWRRWSGRLARARRGEAGLTGRHWDQLEQLRTCFGDLMQPGARTDLDCLLRTRRSWASSAAYAVTGPVLRRSALDAALLRVALALPRRV